MSHPRKLTEDEIEHILHAIPHPDAITKKHSEVARSQIVSLIRDEISEIQLVPEGIEEFIDHIVGQFNAARIKPGSMVGLWATESHGNKIQQDSLNAVHKAGSTDSKGAGGAVDRMKELLLKHASVISSDNDSCTIIFKDIQTRQSIKLEKHAEIVFIDVASLLSTANPYIIEYQSILFPDQILPSWYPPFCNIMNVPLPDTSNSNRKILRLFLDIEHMVELKVVMSDIRKALLSYNSRVLNFYLSPLYLGIVDIWAIEDEVHNVGLDMKKNMEVDIFNLLYGLAEKLHKLGVKGIPGIKDVEPQKVDIWQILTRDQPSKKIRDNVYNYKIYAPSRALLSWERIKQMFDFFNIDIIEYDEENSKYIVLDGRTAPPHEIITKALKEDKQQDADYQKEAIAEKKRIFTRPMTPDRPSYWSEMWYARTTGTNLREIITREDVDPRLTTSNKPHEVLQIFGIIAARRVLLEEIYKSYQGGREEPAFNARHMSLLPDFTTYTGILLPNNSLAVQDRSTLSKATFSRHFDTLMSTAMGVSENLADVSSAIMAGVRLRIGPRAFDYENIINKGVSGEEIKRAMQTGTKSSEEIDKVMQTIMATTDDEPLFGGDIEEGEALDDEENEIYDDETIANVVRGGEKADKPQDEEWEDEVVIRDDDEAVHEDEVEELVQDKQVSSALKATINRFKQPIKQALADSRAEVKKSKTQCVSTSTARKFTSQDLDEIEDLAD